MTLFDLKYIYFGIVYLPYLEGDVPRSPSYGIYILQLRVFSNVINFNNRNQCSAAKLHVLKQGYRIFNYRNTFSKVYRRHSRVVKYNVGEPLLQKGILEPIFYGELVYTFNRIF